MAHQPTPALRLPTLQDLSALYTQGRYADVVKHGIRYVNAQPADATGKTLVAAACAAIGKYKDAERLLRDAIKLQPDKARLHNNLAVVLEQRGKLKAAILSYQKAAQLDPSLAQIHSNLGFAYERTGQFRAAITSYRQACDADANDGNAAVRYWHMRQYCCDWDDNAQMIEEITRLANASAGGEVTHAMPPFPVLAMLDDAAVHLKTAEAFSKAIPGQAHARPPAVPRSAEAHRPLKIAYLSADFHQHATLVLMAELFELHDSSNFEVHAVSFGPDEKSSTLRKRLQDAVAEFYDVRTLSDGQVAQLLRAQQIDIAIDLKGHTTDARPGILASRPVPVQAQWLGYPGTMGAAFIDYVIADPWVIPEDQQPFFSEKVAYLPDCYQVNDRKREIADPIPSRADCGLPEEAFVFACFNRSYKITPETFASWMRILQAVPNSVLWLFETNSEAKSALERHAEEAGVDSNRIVFAPSLPPDKHLARISVADLFLDTFPYGAHTTASDALWSGLPVVTRAGQTFASRVGASLLAAMNMEQLITDSAAAYEALAIDIATTPGRADQLKQQVWRNRDAAALFDSERFCRNLEDLYRRMWDIQTAGRAPESFRIGARKPVA